MPFNLHIRRPRASSQIETIEYGNSSYMKDKDKGITFTKNKRNSSIVLQPKNYGGPSPATYCPLQQSKSREITFGKKLNNTELTHTPGPGSYLQRLDSRGANVIARYRKVRSYFIHVPSERKCKPNKLKGHPGPGDYEVSADTVVLSDYKKLPNTIFQRALRFK